MKPFYEIIDEICKEKNIEQSELSYGWIKRLTKDGVSRNIIRNQLEINGAIAYTVAGDKYATYEVLSEHNIPVILHKIVFNPVTRKGYGEEDFIASAIQFFEENNQKVVIKANNSYAGKDVYLCDKKEEISEIIEKLFHENNNTLSMLPYLDIDYEYRATYLYGEIIYIYKKGKTESWKHNLCNGATPILIDNTDEYVETVKSIAKQAGDAININFANIDIALTSDKKMLVMEINKNVCMNKFVELVPNGYEIAKEIYAKAIDKMF